MSNTETKKTEQQNTSVEEERLRRLTPASHAQAARRDLDDVTKTADEMFKKKAETAIRSINNLMKLTQLQVAKEALTSAKNHLQNIVDFKYDKFEAETGYKAQAPDESQMTRIIEYRDALSELRSEFSNVRTGGNIGKSLKERLTSTAKVIKSMNKGIKKAELKQATIDSYVEVYGGTLVGHEDLLDEVINSLK